MLVMQLALVFYSVDAVNTQYKRRCVRNCRQQQLSSVFVWNDRQRRERERERACRSLLIYYQRRLWVVCKGRPFPRLLPPCVSASRLLLLLLLQLFFGSSTTITIQIELLFHLSHLLRCTSGATTIASWQWIEDRSCCSMTDRSRYSVVAPE